MGLVTPVKNQKDGGNCWAFSGIATLEACLKKATGITYDLSEENAKNLMAAYSVYGVNIDTNHGGYPSMLMSYLTSWLGPVDESVEDYDDYSLLSVLEDPLFNVQNIKWIYRQNTSDNNAIKQAIMDYGAVSITLNWGTAGHAVSLVGWDDNYNGRDCFGNYARGAWIFKNSWGDEWNEEGFGHISYEKTLGCDNSWYSPAYTFIFNDTIYFSIKSQILQDIC